MSGGDSALLSCCRFPECTDYKLEGGNHMNWKQPLQLPTQARARRTTEKRLFLMFKCTGIPQFTFVRCPLRTFS